MSAPKIHTLAYLGPVALPPRLAAAVERTYRPRQPALPLDVEEPMFARSPALAAAAERASLTPA